MLKTSAKKSTEILFAEYDSATKQANSFKKKRIFIEKKSITEERSILDISFTLREDLIYYVNSEKRLRLYISPALK